MCHTVTAIEMSFGKLCSQGDRRLGQALQSLAKVHTLKAGQLFSPSYWQKAMAELGLNPDNYLVIKEPG